MLRQCLWSLLVGTCLLVSLTSAADRTPAPLPAGEAARTMILPEGFRSQVFAAEPLVTQPVSFCFDSRGRVFVAEALNYGEWQPTGHDRVAILEDADGDGQAETRKLFYEGLNYVTGIEVGFGGVWIMSPPSLLFIPDRNADDVPDGPPEVIFDGFGYKESRHNLANGFTWGPDGWLYAGHGRTSPSDVGRPGTPASERIHCDGGVVRIHPVRKVFENFADGTTNPWGVDFDDYGQCFVSNCVNPHLFHIIQGAHYEPWRGRPSSQYAYERVPTVADHWHFPTGRPNEMRGETPEVLAMGGGHAHCGTLVYLADQFPAKYRNTVFLCNVHGRRINNDILKPKGSGYVASHGPDFMLSADPWFMGVTLRSGPEGSLYVSDWSDTGECHTYKPDRATGRIYRISYGTPAKKPSPDLTRWTDAELVQAQLHKNDWIVRQARRLLHERSTVTGWNKEPVHAALATMVETHTEEPARLRALWALRVTTGMSTERLVALLDDRHPHVRGWAVQLLCEDRQPPAEAIAKFTEMAAHDPSPVTRLALASALQRLPEPWAVVAALAGRAEDANDPSLPLVIWYGFEPLVALDPARAMRLARESQIPKVREFAARRAVDHLLSTSKTPHLTPVTAVLENLSDTVRIDLLNGATEALRGQRRLPIPRNWPQVYSQLSMSSRREVREGAMFVALAFDDPVAIAQLKDAVLDRSTPADERQAILQALVENRPPELPLLLRELIEDPDVRSLVLRGLASSIDRPTASRIVKTYATLTPAEKQDAVATLAARRDSAEVLLEALETRTIPTLDVSAYVARQLHLLGDKSLSDRLQKVWGDVRESTPQKQQQIARLKAQLTPAALGRADLQNGRLIFSKTCQQCHKLYGEGGTIGPDLTGSNRSNLEYVLSNVIDPSAEIGRDYRMSVIATTDGRTLSGMITERTPTRIVLQTATERIVLATGDVEDVKDSAISMMPEGQLTPLSKDQIRDLVGYLATQRQVDLPAGK